MTESVKISIPYNVSALENAAGMLLSMAEDLQGASTPTKPRINEGVISSATIRTDEEHPRHAESAGAVKTSPSSAGPAEDKAESSPAPGTPASASDAGVPETQGSAPDPVPEKPAADVELDADGLPWSSEIHSRNKSFDKNGRWKKRRIPKDMTDEQWKAKIAEVEGQLRALMAVGTESAAPAPDADRQSPEDAFPSPETEAPAPAPEPQTETPAPAPAPEPQTEAPTPPPTANDTPDGFQSLMARVTEAVKNRQITTAEVNEIVKRHGVASLPMLGANPKAIAVVWPEIKAAIDRG